MKYGKINLEVGSPPRGRGKESGCARVPRGSRITPAWAGKSPSPECGRLRHGDHPRVGGEKTNLSGWTRARLGSPPRGRGKENGKASCSTSMRITPAWAGKSPSPECGRLRHGDHPRVGGEKTNLSGWTRARLGSPPRGRGKENGKASCSTSMRITPAWAGKRVRPSMALKSSRDHPRVGGEKFQLEVDGTPVCGSPPRGRGKD